MALTITESTAVNRLFDWLTGRETIVGPISDEEARMALAALARSAHRALGAGVTETQVAADKLWPQLTVLREQSRAWLAVSEIADSAGAGDGHARAAAIAAAVSEEQDRLGAAPALAGPQAPKAGRRR